MRVMVGLRICSWAASAPAVIGPCRSIVARAASSVGVDAGVRPSMPEPRETPEHRDPQCAAQGSARSTVRAGGVGHASMIVRNAN